MSPDSPNNAPSAQSVDQLKTQALENLSPGQKAEVQKRLEGIKTERDEKIYFSQSERAKLAEDIKKIGGDTAKIAERIKTEIENERTENKFDKVVKDYEGDDSEGDNEELAANQTRKTILDAWEKDTADLKPEQKEQLQGQVVKLLDIADKNYNLTPGNEMFKGIAESAFEQKILTKKEAQQIAEFIKTEATKIKESNQKKAPEKGKPETDQTPDQIIAAAASDLSKFDVEPWAKKNEKNEFPQTIPAKNQPLVEKITENKEWQATITDLKSRIEKFGIDPAKFETAFKNFVGQYPDWFVTIKGFSGKINKTNTDPMINRLGEFEQHFSSEEQKKQLGDFFKLKGIENFTEDPDWLVRYFAFNNIAEDLKDFDKLIAARASKESQGETVEAIKLAKQKVNIIDSANTSNDVQGPVEKIQAKLGASINAFKEAGDAFMEGDWQKFFGKILEGIFLGGLWNSVKKWMTEEFPTLGEAAASAIEESQTETPRSENPEAANETESEQTPEEKLRPLLNFLGIEAKDQAKAESLGDTTVAALLAAKPEELQKFADDKAINLSSEQLTKLQTQLNKKTITEADREKKLLELLSKKPELLA